MEAQVLTALLGFVFATTFSPGPNNIMASNAGAQFGFVPALPLVAAIWCGTLGVLLAVNLGAAALFTDNPNLKRAIAIFGSLYLLHLAWSVLTGTRRADRAPPRQLLAAAAFQAVNPKAWITMIVLTTTFAPVGASIREAFFVAALFAVVNLVAITTWAGFGAAFRTSLERPSIDRAYRIMVSAALVISVVTLHV